MSCKVLNGSLLGVWYKSQDKCGQGEPVARNLMQLLFNSHLFVVFQGTVGCQIVYTNSKQSCMITPFRTSGTVKSVL